jgi:Spy/CpxP family protein refolding chaperone
MKKSITISIVILVVLTLAASAFAFGPGRGRGHGGRDCLGDTSHLDAIKRIPGMNLTAEQNAKLDAIRDAGIKDIKPILDKMFIKRGDLKLLWLEKNPNPIKIAETKKEIRSLRDQMEDKIDAYRLEALNLLTADQQEKVRSHMRGRGMKGCPCQRAPGHRGGPGMDMPMGDNR